MLRINKIWLVFCMLIIVVLNIIAQQLPQYTQTMFNKLSYNSAFAGIKNSICINLTSRQQWVGFKDKDGKKVNPRTNVISGDMKINEIHGGVGLVMVNDLIGYETNTILKLIYSYHKDFGDGILAIGADLDFLNKKLDYGKFEAVNVSDPLLKSQSEEKNMMFDFGLGAYYNVENKYGFGIYGAQLLQRESDLGSAKFQNKRHFYIIGDYNYVIPNHTDFELTPMGIIKTDISTIQLEANALLKYKKKVWGGLAYRHNDAVGVIIGLAYKDIRIGYSYDITTSKLGYGKGKSNGSHEITVGYCFKIIKEKLPESYKNVRFL